MTAPTPPPPERSLIRASELAQYSFCQRAWWLETVQGIPATSQARRAGGRQQHERHAAQVQAALRWRRTGFLLLAGAAGLVVAALLWWASGGI